MKLNVVPPRAGLLWVRLGLKTFARQPLALTGLFFMFWSAFLLLSLVPLAGLVVALVLTPAGTLGLLLATSEAAEGRFPRPAYLVAGLRGDAARRKQMLVLGGTNAVLVITIILAVSQLASHEPLGGAPAAQGAQDAASLFVLTPAMLVASLLQVPLTLLFTLAPALVFWHGVPAFKALFFSLVALWRNLPALLVFGGAWILLLAAVLTSLGLLLRLIGPAVGLAVVGPVALMLLAMVSTSFYFPFRDSFTADPAPAPATSDGDLP